MSKRQTRTSKATQKAEKRLSQDGSEDEDLEIVERNDIPLLTSRAGTQAARPVLKRKANPNFHGTPTNRIDSSKKKTEKIATRSASGIQKRRIIPDNGEDSTTNFSGPSKKMHRHDDEEEAQEELQEVDSVADDKNYTTPLRKGKEKEKKALAFNSDTRVEEDDEISEDWDHEAMDQAFMKSKQQYEDDGNPSASSSKRRKDDDSGSEDPFANVVARNAMPTPPTKTKKEYLEDFEYFTVAMLPQGDESYFKEVQDPKLRKQYRGLPSLRAGLFLSWSTVSEDRAHIPYSQWPSVIPEMNIGKDSLLMSFLTMTIQGRFFNPSRASPLDVQTRESYRNRRDVYIAKRLAVAVSTGYCTDSYLLRGKFKKSISILFHGQEWERYVCFVTMIFDEKELIAQLYNSALTFSTLPESINAPPSFPNAVLSPLSGRRAKIHDTPKERSRGALFYSDIIPVFDAREITEPTDIDFDDLESTFPRFDGEIPIGSCVAVGHSISTYLGKEEDREKYGTKVHLTTNVLFVILFGMPVV